MTVGTSQKCSKASLIALGIKRSDDAFRALEERLVIVTESVQTGEEFANAVRLLVAKHKPDLVWLDPLLSFIGDDISKQDVCSYFLRNLLNPIAHETGVVWMMMHHTPKPSTDPKSKSGWNATDHSYAGTGSSELTNWARAVCVLQSTKDEGRFALRLAKRNNRAGATELNGDRTNLIHLKHSEGSILWEQTAAPIVIDPASKEKKPKKTVENLDQLIAKINRPMKKSRIVALAEEGGHSTKYIAQRDWPKIAEKLFQNQFSIWI